MPLYDYRCRACSKVNEVRHGFREAYQGTCAECGSADLARVFNPAGIVFKGSGFYVNDSRKPAASESAAAKSASGSEPSSGAPASASETASAKSSSGSDAGSSSTAPASTPSTPSGASAPKKNEASAA
jgi:putative FmdB family regulatory protein